MRLICALVFAVLLSATAMADPRSIPRLSQLIIKEFNVKDASFTEAVGKVQEAWQQKYPDDPFPVILVQELEKPAVKSERVTAELKNIPATEALTYIADAFFIHVRFELDMVYLSKTSEPADAVLQWRVLEVSPKAARILGFPSSTTTDFDARKSLQKFGMQVDGETMATFASGRLVIQNTRPQLEKVAGILLLIDSGYTITKDPSVK